MKELTEAVGSRYSKTVLKEGSIAVLSYLIFEKFLVFRHSNFFCYKIICKQLVQKHSMKCRTFAQAKFYRLNGSPAKPEDKQ